MEIPADQNDAALQDFNSVLRIEPNNISATYYRGSVYEKTGQWDMAIKDFNTVLDLDPNHIKAYYSRAACRNRKGELALAIGEPHAWWISMLTCAPAWFHQE